MLQYMGTSNNLCYLLAMMAGLPCLLAKTLDPCMLLCRIQTRQAAALLDKRIVVVIDGWATDSMYPHGHYVRTLGVIGEKDTETVRQTPTVEAAAACGCCCVCVPEVG